MDDKQTESESNNTLTDAVVQAEPAGESLTGSASISLLKLSDSNEDVKNSVRKQNNGNGTEKNAQKRIKTDSVDGTCKKPRTIMSETPREFTNKPVSDEFDNLSDAEEYYLTVSNLPDDWTFVEIKNYLDKECGHVDEMEMVKHANNQTCAVRLTFQSSEKCNDVFQKLQDKVIDNNKLDVELTEPCSIFPPVTKSYPAPSVVGEEKSKMILPKRPWRPDQDIWETDPDGLYGLRPQFLKSLDITPPIDNWVHVSNFRCDKNELKEVMELAGNVLMCCMVHLIHKYAKVMYSHPIEAVQAISMLNGQMYYGSPLKVSMDTCPTDLVLPKGLSSIGLGLGLEGKPLRNVAHQYERYAKNKSSTINPVVFSKVIRDGHGSVSILKSEQEDVKEIQSKIDEFVAAINTSLPKEKPFIVKSIDEFEKKDSPIPKSESNRSTPDKNVAKASPGVSKKSGVGSPSPSATLQTKNGSEKPIKKLNKSTVSPIAPNIPGTSVPIRLSNPSPGGFPRPNLPQNPQVPNPLPIPAPRHPNYGPGPINIAGNQPHPPFGPRPAPFMPVQRPGFAPQPRPMPFGPRPGMMPQMPPANFHGPRPFVNQNSAGPRPNINPGNRVTVHFSNLPPSTTFPLLCEQLAHCGQVMSVQLTTPGCAVATFGHPSHAERCFQTYNNMNAEGYIIEVKFA